MYRASLLREARELAPPLWHGFAEDEFNLAIYDLETMFEVSIKTLSEIMQSSDYKILQTPYTLLLIKNLLFSFRIGNMLDKGLVLSSVLKALSSSGLPEAEWAGVLRAALRRIDPESTSLPDEIARRWPAPISAEAKELFGEAPTPIRPATYTKSDFPIEWFDDIDIVRAARKTANDFKKRDKTLPVNPDEVERARAAYRFVKAVERRNSRLKAVSPNSPPPSLK